MSVCVAAQRFDARTTPPTHVPILIILLQYVDRFTTYREGVGGMKTGQHEKMAQRLAIILTWFNEGRCISKEELIEEFNITERTIDRDLKRLSFLPIEKDKDRGCYKLESYALGKLTYSDIRRFAEYCGVKELYPELSDNMIVDILNARLEGAMEVRGHRYEDLSRRVDDFNRLAAAIVQHAVLSFDYKQKHRKVFPYKLSNINGIWYLIGTEDGIIKHFTFSKINNLIVLNETFAPDRRIITLLDEHRGVWVTQKPLEVLLEVDAEVAEYFVRRPLLPNQQIEYKGREVWHIRSRAAYETEILKTVRYWMPHLRILEPASLHQTLLEELRDYLRHFS